MMINFLEISLTGVCLGAILQDLQSRKVSNQNLLIAYLAVVLVVAIQGGLPALGTALLSSVTLFGIGYLFWRFRVLGAGDVKLLSLVALGFSWSRSLEMLFLSFVWGALFGLVALLLDKNLWQEAKVLNFHPILTIRSKRVKGHKVPFTVGIFLGLISTWLLEAKGVHLL